MTTIEKWERVNAELIATKCSSRHIQSVIEDAKSDIAKLSKLLDGISKAGADVLGKWVPAHERVPDVGTECVVLVRYSLDKPPFATVDTWDVQREDPLGMGGPTIETGMGWNDNFENDVIAWIAIPPYPPAEWDQRISSEPDANETIDESISTLEGGAA